MSRVLAEEDKQLNKQKKSNANRKKTRRAQNKMQNNLLDYIPVRNCDWGWQEKNNKLIRIIKLRFDTKFGKKVGNKLKIKPTYNINLDEYGTAIWRLCDGKLTVREIGEMLKTQFGSDVEPLYPRLAEFLRILKINKLILLEYKPAQKKSAQKKIKK